MLFYIRCPSCGRVISENLDKFTQERMSILNDPSKTPSQREELDAKLLDKYGYNHIHCRMRVKTQLPYHDIIVS